MSTLPVRETSICAQVEQDSHPFLVTLPRRPLQGRVAAIVIGGSVVKVRTCTRQQTHDIEVSIALPVNSVQISPRAAENLHDGAIRVLHRSMERCADQGSVAQYRKARARSIWVRPCRDKEVCRPSVPVPRHNEDWRATHRCW